MGKPDLRLGGRAAAGNRTRLVIVRTTIAVLAVIAAAGSLFLGWILVAADQATDPLIAGRRGDVASWPENTIEGVRSAMAVGAEAIEIDVRASADGNFFLMHDASVDRTTSGSGAIAELADSAVQDLVIDGGLGFRPDHAGLRVPRLTEVLEATADFHGILLLDGKGGPSEHAALRELVLELGIANRVWIGCYSSAEVDAVAGATRTYGASHTGADTLLLGTPIPLVAWFRESTVVAVDQSHVGDESEFLDRARRWGVDVYITNDLAAALQSD
jgi:glycerophosphoryl diester phosphodiesterase